MSIGILVGSQLTTPFRNTTSTDSYLQGVPFDDSVNWRLDVVQRGQQILGDRILGFQAGNEPDLYLSHGRRNEVNQVVRVSLIDQMFTCR
jgi:hypothetical protein